MILTHKSITKNLSNITDDNELVTNFLAFKSKVYKRGILALTSFGKIIITNAPLFGKVKIQDSFFAKDVEYVDYVSEIKMGGPQVHIILKLKGENIRFTAFFSPVNNDANVNEILRTIYAANPSAIPEYVKNKEVIDYLTTKDGCYKITNDEIIVQELENETIKNKEPIYLKDISDFDVYPQKLGSKGILYLELNNEPKLVKFEKTTDENSIETMLAGGTSVMFTLRSMSDLFVKSGLKLKNPTYMTESEVELVTEFAAKKALGIEELGNKLFRLTSEHIYYLKKEKSGKLSISEKIPLNTIASYKMLSHRTDNKTTFGLQITTTSNESYKYWSLDLIDMIMDELKRNL
jgi:hypothetical protein